MACRVIKIRPTAWSFGPQMRGTAACVGMRVVWTPPNHGSSARDMNGKCAGSAALVQLKRVEPRFHALVGPVFILAWPVKD